MAQLIETVRGLVERDGAIRRDLRRGLINMRALARYLQARIREGTGEEASFDAIISALRRIRLEEDPVDHRRIGALLKKLTMRNKIVDVAIRNDPDIPAALGRIAPQIDFSRGETFRIVSGVESVRVIIDEKNLDKLEAIPKGRILKVDKDLVEIIISLDEVAERTPGVVATVTLELAIHGINLIEFMSCVPELIMVVEEKDALRSYELLERLAKGAT